MHGDSEPLLLAYYGDDFTGSTDALDFLSRNGVRTVLFIKPPSRDKLARYPGLRAIGLAGRSRSMQPTEMECELRPAFEAMRELQPRHVHYKVCSTFDSSPQVGSIGRAAEIGREIFPGSCTPLVVGAPALGRYCLFGNLFARMGIGSTGAIHRLDRHPAMSRHPVTPADEADLRRHLARQTSLKVALLDILQLAGSRDSVRKRLEALLADSPDMVLFDVLENEHLGTIGELIDRMSERCGSLFSVGSSGIEMALSAHWSEQGRVGPPASWPDPGPAQPLLVLSGSCSPVTAGQIDWALQHGFSGVELDAAALAAGADPVGYAQRIAANLRDGMHVVAYTSRGGADAGIQGDGAARLGTALGRMAHHVLENFPLKRILLAGGDSSSHAAHALGIEALEMIAPLMPGAPLCRASAVGSPAHGCEMNFKGGQVGPPDYFGTVALGTSRGSATSS